MGDLERRLGSAAAYVGGAITAAGTLAAGIMVGQVVIARLTIPGAEAPPPRSSGLYGREYGDGAPLRLAVLGDSTAAGYGVHVDAETPGAHLALGLSARFGLGAVSVYLLSGALCTLMALRINRMIERKE